MSRAARSFRSLFAPFVAALDIAFFSVLFGFPRFAFSMVAVALGCLTLWTVVRLRVIYGDEQDRQFYLDELTESPGPVDDVLGHEGELH